MTQRYLPADNPDYLSRQLITYLGNKRALLSHIDRAVCDARDGLGGRKLRCADLFSGSGVVARLLKRHAHVLYVNDLEGYSAVLNRCYLTNREDFPEESFAAAFEQAQKALRIPVEGIVSRQYAPADDGNIQPGERVFYTRENALTIDTLRAFIDGLEEPLKPYFLAPLLAEASVHANTGGVFKGFYKDSATGLGKFGGNGENALTRILGSIELHRPVLSDFSCESHVFQKDAGQLAGELPPLDLVYLDPPYNQHPYGSNYFILNIINENRLPGALSRVSGIPQGWNRSAYNRPTLALAAFSALVEAINARFVLISYNSEGFITLEQMEAMLGRLGRVTRQDISYNAYRASRNLSGRQLHVKEYLFLLEKSL
ncbi:MAG: DNA adenine methylase [Clostridia bacterium]|nr:DNA adenine methylase [Clostridia bacterium]